MIFYKVTIIILMYCCILFGGWGNWTQEEKNRFKQIMSKCREHVKIEGKILTTYDSIPSDGWFTFANFMEPGLHISKIKTYQPNNIIPNTADGEFKYPILVRIHPQGKWILYTAIDNTDDYKHNCKTFLIKKDGTGKTEVPFPAKELEPYQLDGKTYNRRPETVGFIIRSPKNKDEIFYVSKHYEIRALEVDLSGETPVFPPNTDRVILDVKTAGAVICAGFGCSDIHVNKDMILLRIDVPYTGTKSYRFNGNPPPRTGYITIPNNGLGTATLDNLYQFKKNPLDTLFYANFTKDGNGNDIKVLTDDYTEWWGCGHAISWDGTLAVANVGYMGGHCAPGHRMWWIDKDLFPNGASHKGIYITPFRRKGETPEYTLWQHSDSVNISISVNWVPMEAFKGNFDDGFVGWNFGNRNDWLITTCMPKNGHNVSLFGAMTGAWLVNWQKNTYKIITPNGANPKTVMKNTVAVYFDEPTEPYTSIDWQYKEFNKLMRNSIRVVFNNEGLIISTGDKYSSAQIISPNGRIIERIGASDNGDLFFNYNRAKSYSRVSGVYIVKVYVGNSIYSVKASVL